jgi:hypothetical protein
MGKESCVNNQIAEIGSQQATATQGMGRNLTLDVASMNSMMSLANIMATGKVTIPQEYRNSPGDCLAVVMQAVQWGMNPFAVAQKTHFVTGKIGYEAQLVNAVITALAPTKDRLHFEWFGDWSKVIGKFDIKKGDKGEYRVPAWAMKDEEGLGIKVWATIKGEEDPRILELFLAQARTRNSTLWADDPRQQLAYLATKRWARLYCPDVIMGVYTPDEFDDVRIEREINPVATSRTENRTLNAMRGHPSETIEPSAEPPQMDETPITEKATVVDHTSAYADHCAAIEGSASIDEWKPAYTAAWAWASETGDQAISDGIKQVAGERKAQLNKTT